MGRIALHERAPGFSIVTPTYQRRASLARLLARLAAVDYPADCLEMLVVSDGATDGTIEMLRSVAPTLPFPVRVFEQANRGPSAARNLALRHARGPFVLFLDDDVIPVPGLVAEHRLSHADSTSRVVIGPFGGASDSSSPWVRWQARLLAEHYRAMEMDTRRPTAFDFYTGNASVLLRHVRRVGGFDVRLLRAQDVELGLRLAGLGLEFTFNPNAAGEHITERSFRTWLDIARRYAHSHVILDMPKEHMCGGLPGLHPLTRALIRWVIRHPKIERVFPAAARVGIEGSDVLRLGALTHRACGAAFNISYWLGLVEALGPEGAASLVSLDAGGLPDRRRGLSRLAGWRTLNP